MESKRSLPFALRDGLSMPVSMVRASMALIRHSVRKALMSFLYRKSIGASCTVFRIGINRFVAEARA